MTITTCQKVTLISCSVLCVSLFLPGMLLPRGKKEKGHPEVGPGFYPSIMHQLSVKENPDQWDVDLSPSLAQTVEAMAQVKSIKKGKKYNLMAQVIPIYGFGILLYILYIIYKLTCRKKTNKSRNGFNMTNTNASNTIMTDYEFVRLQERLLQTEMMMQKIVSEKGHFPSSRKSKSSISKKEEKLLRQLRQITLLMQEGRLDGASPEMEAEEVPYGADWEGYPEETYPEYDVPTKRSGFSSMKLEEHISQPTAEALAERMEQEEEEIAARKLSTLKEEDEEEEKSVEENEDEEEEEEEIEVDMEDEEEEKLEEIEEDVEDEEEEEAEKMCLLSSPQNATEKQQKRASLEVREELQQPIRGKKQITFSEQKHVFHYPPEETLEEESKEEEVSEEAEETDMEEEEEDNGETEEDEEEDDPLMEAESLQFGVNSTSNTEEESEEDEEEFVLIPLQVEGEGQIHTDTLKEVGVSGLRMRNRRET